MGWTWWVSRGMARSVRLYDFVGGARPPTEIPPMSGTVVLFY